MKNFKIYLLVFLVCLGCSRQRILSSGNFGKNEPNYEHSQDFWIYGIGQTQDLNAVEICKGKGGVEKTETIQTFVNGLLGFITFGIYYPRTVRVYCRS